jgi:biotin operon repressor
MSDWIKLHRALLEWEWYTTPNMVHFWIHCLLKATHRSRKWKGIELNEGQFISGRLILSAETGLSEQQIRTCIERLKSTNELTSKSTSEYSVEKVSTIRNDQPAT